MRLVADGLGTFKYKDGATLSGEWRKGLRHGQIAINYKNGDKFVGQCKHDRVEGVGELTCKSGYHYTGQWRRNLVSFLVCVKLFDLLKIVMVND